MHQFIEAAACGDSGARRVLVERLRRSVRHYAVSLSMRTGADRNDLEQEGWVGVFEALREVDVKIGKPQFYLLKKARWRMLDYIRRRSRNDLVFMENVPERETSGSSTMPLFIFFKRLNEKKREILILLQKEYTRREIGGILGISAANVTYHVKQMRKIFRLGSNERK